MTTHWIDLAVGSDTMPAYVAEPAGAPRGGVVVLHEIFGVNDDMQRIANLLAGDGYLAIAPNVFHRTDPDFSATHDDAGFAKGRAAAGAIVFQQVVADMTACGEYLRERLGSQAKVATWGFCFGGSLAFASATLPFVAAAVSFYGGQIANAPGPGRAAMLEMTPHLTAPLFLAFGGRDAYIPAADVERIRTELERHGKAFEAHVYADEDHGFFRHGPDGNDGSRAVWPLVRAFLAAALEPEHAGT